MSISIGLFALAISLSSLSSKAAGLAWLCLCVSGVVVWLRMRRQPFPNNPVAEGTDLAKQVALLWLLTCLAAFVLMAIPTAYWSGPWAERHPQWRLLLAAMGVCLLLRHQVPAGRALQVLASAVAISSLLAYGLVITMSSDAAPTNRIPWMAGLSLFSCTLLTLSYGLKSANLNLRRLWLGASALMLVTVLLSGVRGSFPLLLIWPLALLGMHRSDPALWRTTWRWMLPMLIVLFAVGLPLIPESDNPLVRILAVIRETGTLATDSPVLNDTSSGIRLILYRTGLHHVLDNPLWGVGSVAAKELIHQALIAAGVIDPSIVIGHFHSDLLNPWVESGILGLMGYLSYLIGALLIAWRLGRGLTDATMSVGVLALALMHISTGLTNMNLAHNYYPTMLAISLALIFLCIPSQPRSVRN